MVEFEKGIKKHLNKEMKNMTKLEANAQNYEKPINNLPCNSDRSLPSLGARFENLTLGAVKDPKKIGENFTQIFDENYSNLFNNAPDQQGFSVFSSTSSSTFRPVNTTFKPEGDVTIISPDLKVTSCSTTAEGVKVRQTDFATESTSSSRTFRSSGSSRGNSSHGFGL